MGYAHRNSVAIAAGFGVGLTAGAGLACSIPGAFACTGDDQCVSEGVAGRCELSGFCSFPDDSCDSSSRYGAKAPANLAGTCVEPMEGTGVVSGEASGGSTSQGPTADASGSSGSVDTADDSGDTGPLPACGDGRVDAGEACDDGNAIDGDGCNANCVVSGSVRWSTTFTGTGTDTDRAMGVAVTEDGGLIVSGYLDNDTRDGFVHRFDRERITWSFLLDGGGGQDECRQAAVLSDGSIAVAGAESTAMLTTAWVGVLDPDGELVWEDSAADLGLSGGARSVAAGPNGRIAIGGLLGDDGFVQVYDAPNTTGWGDQIVAPAPETTVHGLVYAGDVLHVAGWRASLDTDRDFWVRAYDESGVMLWDDTYDGGQDGGQNGNPDDRFHAILLTADTLVATGRTGIQAGNDVVAARYDLQGNALQPVTQPTRAASSALDAAAMPDGDLVLVGWESPKGDNPTVGWARRYGLDGTLRWETLFGEPDVGNDWLGGVALLDSGELIVVGTTLHEGSHDAFIARLAP